MAGELDALVKSFAGEPELYDPVRGRIKGARAFEAAVYVRGESGKLAAARIYDDTDPPLGVAT